MYCIINININIWIKNIKFALTNKLNFMKNNVNQNIFDLKVENVKLLSDFLDAVSNDFKINWLSNHERYGKDKGNFLSKAREAELKKQQLIELAQNKNSNMSIKISIAVETVSESGVGIADEVYAYHKSN